MDRSRFYRQLKPRLFAAARPFLVTPSRWLASRVREVPALAKLPVRVIPHRIDFDVFEPLPGRESLRRRFGLEPDLPTVVMAGHTWTDSFKGGQQAIGALRSAHRKLGRLQLLIVGEASDRLLAASGLPGRALPFVEVRETLAAAEYTGTRVRWLGFSDFGYSKTAAEAFKMWGKDKYVARLKTILDEGTSTRGND
ncbi:MAG: hypothetical protein IIA66_04145 [Planctomycetes bacterium]|nr:hypothetical protein [Planctomycetota bacterium]